MTSKAGELLIAQIIPIILGAIASGTVKPMDTEDVGELQQDCVASAAAMLDAAEAHGRPMVPRAIAYYALQRAKIGRRAMSAARMDAMSPGAILDGNSTMVSMDAPVDEDPECTDLSLHDMLEDHRDGPDVEAARGIDWSQVMATMPARQREIIRCTAEGYGPKEIAIALKTSAPNVVQTRHRVARRIREAWGDRVLQDVARRPVWRRA